MTVLIWPEFSESTYPVHLTTFTPFKSSTFTESAINAPFLFSLALSKRQCRAFCILIILQYVRKIQHLIYFQYFIFHICEFNVAFVLHQGLLYAHKNSRSEEHTSELQSRQY